MHETVWASDGRRLRGTGGDWKCLQCLWAPDRAGRGDVAKSKGACRLG